MTGCYVITRELWINTRVGNGNQTESVFSGTSVIEVHPGTQEGYDAAFKSANDAVKGIASRRRCEVKRHGGRDTRECRIWFDAVHESLVYVVKWVPFRELDSEQAEEPRKTSKKERK